MRRLALDASEIFIFDGASPLNMDFIVPAERFVSGGEIVVEGAALGDYIVAQVLAPNGFMLAEYIHKRFVIPINNTIFKAVLDGTDLETKIPAGFILRIIYVSNELRQRTAVINYNFEIIL